MAKTRKTISPEKKELLCTKIENEEMTICEVAEKTGFAIRTVRKWMTNYRKGKGFKNYVTSRKRNEGTNASEWKELAEEMSRVENELNQKKRECERLLGILRKKEEEGENLAKELERQVDVCDAIKKELELNEAECKEIVEEYARLWKECAELGDIWATRLKEFYEEEMEGATKLE